MGYSTDFYGSFKLDKKLDDETHTFLKKLNETRRVARNLDTKYGIEGEFYVDGSGFRGQDRDSTIINYNMPPRTQPSLWCGWVPSEDGLSIEWDGSEKFYDYIEWIKYIIDKVLEPLGYVVNGEVEWQGEDRDDRGLIVVSNNEVSSKHAVVSFVSKED